MSAPANEYITKTYASEAHALLGIDDEVEIVKALRRYFRREYAIFTANSADEGYQIMTSIHFTVHPIFFSH